MHNLCIFEITVMFFKDYKSLDELDSGGLPRSDKITMFLTKL